MSIKEQIDQRYTGMFWATFRADPLDKETTGKLH